MPIPELPVAALVSLLAVINVTPEPIAFQLGSVPVYWYGICYAVGLALTYVVITREARRRGLAVRLVDNGIIIVGIAALLGGRLYHVIDQWQLYLGDPIKIFLPPYTGLGVYGGILTGTLAVIYLTHRWHQSLGKWLDVIAPGVFVMQAIARWGNFFNQELYGPPTNLPWGIAIDCEHRVTAYPCSAYPAEVTAFHPLFLYESLSGILGAVTLLWIARRWGGRMRPGDLFLIFLAWYATVRLLLETLRTGNWTFFGVPTAIIISGAIVVGSLALLAYRNRPSAAGAARWGDPPDDDDEDDDGGGDGDLDLDAHEHGGDDGGPDAREADDGGGDGSAGADRAAGDIDAAGAADDGTDDGHSERGATDG